MSWEDFINNPIARFSDLEALQQVAIVVCIIFVVIIIWVSARVVVGFFGGDDGEVDQGLLVVDGEWGEATAEALLPEATKIEKQ